MPGSHALLDIAEGVRDGLVFIPLYLPLAIAFAIAARMAGLPEWQVVLWSAALAAGSAQLACLSALMAGAGMVELLIITFMANARHGLIGLALAPFLGSVTRRAMPFMGFTLVTSSVGLFPAKLARGGSLQAYGLAAQYCQWGQWVVFTYFGVRLAPMLPAAWAPVLAFAVPAAFLGMLAPLVRESRRSGQAAALVAAVLGLGLTVLLPAQVCAIVAALAGAAAGVLVPEERQRDR